MVATFYAVDEDWVEAGTKARHIGGGSPRPKKGGSVIVFARTSDEILFLGTSKILDIGPLERDSDSKSFVVVEFAKIHRWQNPRKLSEVAGSLWRVRRFLQPARHFARHVNVLIERDFRTIETGRVDVYRSVFRYLFASLPVEVQAEFIRTYPGGVPLSKQGYVTGYSQLAPVLLKFFRQRIEPPLQLLTDIAAAHERLTRDRRNGVPGIRTLVLTQGDGESPVNFGTTLNQTVEFIRDNALFPHGNRGALLLECETAVATAIEARDKGQKWRDLIF